MRKELMIFSMAFAMLLLTSGLMANDFRLAVKGIVEEAEKSLKEEDKWPRENPTFIADNKMELTAKEIMSKCMGMLDKRPAMDAYIKFQLLGSIEDDKVFMSKNFGRLMSKLPAIIRTPQPGLRHRLNERYQKLWTLVNSTNVIEKNIKASGGNFRGTLTKIEKVSSKQLPIIKEIADEYFFARDMVRAANKPNFDLREMLMRRLPDGNAARISFIAQDVQDRLKAQDVTYRDVADVLMGDIQVFSKSPELSKAGRRVILNQVRKLAGSGSYNMVKNITVGDNGDVFVEVIRLWFPASYVNAAQSWLAGRDPTSDIKSWSQLDADEAQDDADDEERRKRDRRP